MKTMFSQLVFGGWDVGLLAIPELEKSCCFSFGLQNSSRKMVNAFAGNRGVDCNLQRTSAKELQ